MARSQHEQEQILGPVHPAFQHPGQMIRNQMAKMMNGIAAPNAGAINPLQRPKRRVDRRIDKAPVMHETGQGLHLKIGPNRTAIGQN